jgi:hypothetical protein
MSSPQGARNHSILLIPLGINPFRKARIISPLCLHLSQERESRRGTCGRPGTSSPRALCFSGLFFKTARNPFTIKYLRITPFLYIYLRRGSPSNLLKTRYLFTEIGGRGGWEGTIE